MRKLLCYKDSDEFSFLKGYDWKSILGDEQDIPEDRVNDFGYLIDWVHNQFKMDQLNASKLASIFESLKDKIFIKDQYSEEESEEDESGEETVNNLDAFRLSHTESRLDESSYMSEIDEIDETLRGGQDIEDIGDFNISIKNI